MKDSFRNSKHNNNNVIPFQGHGNTDNIFLVPMHGGIWTLCIDLTDADMRQLGRYGFPHASKCISYLAESIELSQHDEFSLHGDYQMARRPSMRKYHPEKKGKKKTKFI